MKLIFITILFGALHCFGFNEVSLLKTRGLGQGQVQCLGQVQGQVHVQVQEIPADSTNIAEDGNEETKERKLYKKLEDFGKTKALLYLVFFLGGISLLWFSDRLLRISDMLLLRVQRRPNAFDGFQFTGNPFILKKPFFAIYHMFLGSCAYQSYLVWPLKYTAAISFLATIMVRLFSEEALPRPINLQAILQSPLSVQLILGIIALLFLAVQVLLIIESIRKTRWFFPLRLLVFLLLEFVISVLVYKLFWLVFGLAVLYLFTHLGRDFIGRQKHATTIGYSTEENIYEPWSDGAEKTYH